MTNLGCTLKQSEPAGISLRGKTVASTICGLLLATLFATSQQPDEGFKLTTDANLVLLDVSVKDSAGHYVSNLTKSNFHVFDQSKPQVISQFTSEDAPVTVGL